MTKTGRNGGLTHPTGLIDHCNAPHVGLFGN
jgi:hypothetical protein